MTTIRAWALLLGTLTLAAGCHKKPPAEGGGEAGTSDDGGAAEASASDDGSAEAAADAATDSSAPTEAGTDQTEGGAPEAGPTTPTTPTTVGGSGYAGTFSCFGILTLAQSNNTVSGNAVLRTGASTQSTDFSCKIVGDKCHGSTNVFSSVNGQQPKERGKGKVTFRIVNGGLDYTQTVGGSTQQGFCKRI
jgi:hypothetical protein